MSEAQAFCDKLDDFLETTDESKWFRTFDNAPRTSMRYVTSKFLEKRDKFRFKGRPIGVDVAYHYTSDIGAEGISKHGLCKAHGKRKFFGQGIYTANNPHAFKHYGETGIILLVVFII